MKFLFDLFPVILFFIAYKLAGVYMATLAAIFATAAQIVFVWIKHRKVDKMLWISLILIVVFGGATLLLHDEQFIKWKPTVLYWTFAVGLLISATMFKKNLMRMAMGQHIQLEDKVWRALNFAWSGFFVLMGVANWYVATYYSTDTWVNFKLFGSTGLTLAFVIIQSIWLARHIKQDDQV